MEAVRATQAVRDHQMSARKKSRASPVREAMAPEMATPTNPPTAGRID
jgi:hypothetical protein